MYNTIPIVKLSKQAGHILSHLNWLPKEVQVIVNRFPYHSARLFALGMEYILNKSSYYTALGGKDPIEFLSSSSYGNTLNIGEFAGFVPIGTVGLLLSIGAIAEQALIDKQDLKRVLVPGNQSVQLALDQYNGQKNEFQDLTNKNKNNRKGQFIDLLVQAIDAGASNLAGLKECYLVASYYERAYNRANHVNNHLHGKIDQLDYELHPFPDMVESKDGDKFIFDKPGVRFERNWPDILLRDGKYSIVHHNPRALDLPMMMTPDTSNFEDIRMAESHDGDMACFVLCKREGKWGAVYSNGLQFFFILVVPFIYDTPEEVAREVNNFIDYDNYTKWVSWDDFKGIFHDPD